MGEVHGLLTAHTPSLGRDDDDPQRTTYCRPWATIATGRLGSDPRLGFHAGLFSRLAQASDAGTREIQGCGAGCRHTFSRAPGGTRAGGEPSQARRMAPRLGLRQSMLLLGLVSSPLNARVALVLHHRQDGPASVDGNGVALCRAPRTACRCVPNPMTCGSSRMPSRRTAVTLRIVQTWR